jgi:hypothetical protein
MGAGDGRRINDLASIGAVRHAFLILGSCPAWHLAETSALQAQHRTHRLPDDDTSTAIDAWMAVHRKQQALTPAYDTLRGFDQDGFR